MSGIGGIVRLDGAPVASRDLDAMSAAIAHRGGDDNRVWSNDSVAFAHAMLRTTAESHTEPQPFVDGPLTIVADARLDNRAELLALLGIRDESIGDAAILLAAFRKWDHACLFHIEGDFAFAIWNERDRSLFCARDPFGVKQFVYAERPRKLFAFASEVRALLALNEIPRDVDEKRIANFLAIYFDEPERTFHQAIRRLPGGCSLTLRDGEIVTERYWSPEHVAPLRLRGANRDARYAEGFREHFVRAVRERMRFANPSEIGAMLSGGLDSTSIACVARDELRASHAAPLPVFSWIFSDHMEADEREYQDAVIADGGMRQITLDSASLNISPWSDVDALLPDGPPYAPNHYLNNVAARHAREIGVRIMLDGTGGDSTISRGRGRYLELFFRGRALTLASELRALARLRGTNESLPRLFYANVAAPLMPRPLLAIVQRLRGRASTNFPTFKLLGPRMREQIGVPTVQPSWYASTRREHLAQLLSPMVADGLELLDHSMAMHRVEGRYPFFDRRLAEYCLALPADQKLTDGYTRSVARRAMAGVVPDKVRWRAGKGLPGLHIFSAMRRDRAILEDLVRDRDVLAPYVDMDVLNGMYTELLSERPIDFRTVIQLWSAAILARWLRLDAERQNVLSA
ncbi:MAG TPA: asparagine synthase-related protein [Thermoanaerobaculia bacterium]|jgi:asparagine synthase (glutamine-hydrolysing)|nr:asparagine synthase-related protein [Thermoanaerobaculia bacterium]